MINKQQLQNTCLQALCPASSSGDQYQNLFSWLNQIPSKQECDQAELNYRRLKAFFSCWPYRKACMGKMRTWTLWKGLINWPDRKIIQGKLVWKWVKECLHQSTQIIEYISRTFIETTQHNQCNTTLSSWLVSPGIVHIVLTGVKVQKIALLPAVNPFQDTGK